MPTFAHRLPALGKHQGYELRRTPASGNLTGVITADQLLVCDTHFWHGRTMPCERICNADGKTIDDSPCPACVNKQPFRSHAYVSAFSSKTSSHFIFECTAIAAKPIEEYCDANGTIRGCALTAFRPKGGQNSKVVILTNTINLRSITLPPAPNVAAALAVIWRLPKTAIETILTEPGAPTIHTVNEVLDEIRNQEPNAAGPEAFAARKETITAALLKAAANGNGKPHREKAKA